MSIDMGPIDCKPLSAHTHTHNNYRSTLPSASDYHQNKLKGAHTYINYTDLYCTVTRTAIRYYTSLVMFLKKEERVCMNNYDSKRRRVPVCTCTIRESQCVYTYHIFTVTLSTCSTSITILAREDGESV